MAKFSRSGKKGVVAISTASLPDIVFMLLFFFMVSTVMREVSLKITVSAPNATEVTKLENKSLVSYIYIGVPLRTYQGLFGTEPRIQLNDQFQEVSDIMDFVAQERDKLSENDQKKMTISLKIDRHTKMGVVTDVKQALRRASALKINYSARQGEVY